MGRGGTKFESEAIGNRDGRQKKGPSLKDLKKEMETFQKTGKHPALDGRDQHVLPTLPVRDPNRPHVFFAFSSGKADLGRVLVEVFEPELPITCRTFLNRCNPGAANSFKGTKVHRVVQNYALHAGISKGHKSYQQRRNEYLLHVQPGLVSLSISGDAFAISFDRALTMDDTHQVVGRVHGEASMKVVERLNTTAVGLNDEPVQAMRVSDCGPTDSQGNYDPLLAGSRRKENADEAAARLRAEEADARAAVGDALEKGLAPKRELEAPNKDQGGGKRRKPALVSESEDSLSSSDDGVSS